MKALQYIYTSWKNGSSSDKGYMIYSKSEEITNEECNDIKSIMQYMIPKKLKLNPTKEEINDYFPFSFAYFRLSSGRCCIANTTYLGKDYSGRYGNYIIYALVLEINEIQIYPVELFAEPYIKTYMTEKELNASSPVPPLEQIEITEFGNIVNDDIIMEFIEDREEEFAYLLSALLKSIKENKPLFIHDTRENIVLWVASIQKILPLENAKKFTFTTYLGEYENHRKNAKLKLNCIGVNPEANYFSYEIEKNSSRQICINFINGEKTPNIQISRYVKSITSNFSLYSEEIYEFNNFIEETSYNEFNEDINIAFDAYSLYNGNVDSLIDYDLYKIIDFAQIYCSSRQNCNIATKIIELLYGNIPKVQIVYLPKLFNYIFENAGHLLSKVYEIYYDTFFEIASNIERDEISILFNVFDESMKLSHVYMNGYLDYFLSDESISRSKLYLEDNKNIVLNLCYLGFITSKYKSNNSSKVISDLLNILTKNIYTTKDATENVILAMDYVKNNVDIYVEIMVGYNNCLKYSAEKEVFYNKVEEQFSSYEDTFIEKMENELLSNNQNFQISTELFLRKLKRSKKADKIFWDYYNHLICPVIVYRDVDISKLIKGYIEAIDWDKRYRYIVKVIDNIDASYIKDNNTIKYILDEIENTAVSKLFKVSSEDLNKLLALSARLSTEYRPDIIRAVLYGQELDKIIRNKKAKNNSIYELVINENLNLNKMNKNDYSDYLEEYLQFIVLTVRNENDIKSVLKQFNHEKYSDILYSIYIGIVGKIRKKDEQRGEILIINTCLFIINNRNNILSNELEPFVIKYCSKQKKDDIEYIENMVKARTNNYYNTNFFNKVYKKDSLVKKILFKNKN